MFSAPLRRWAASIGAAILAGLGLARPAAAQDEPLPHHRYEPALIPVVGGNSDVGLGGGALFSLTRIDPRFVPYLWHVEGAAFLTAGSHRTDVTFPYQEYFAELTLPSVLDKRLRLVIRPSYNREANLQYWGLGNASVYAPKWTSIDPEANPKAYDAALRENEYILLRPALRVDARLTVRRPFYIMVGGMFTQNAADVDANSKMADDRAGASGRVVQHIVAGPDSYSLMLFDSSLLYDSRDNEVAPDRGMFHKLGFRGAPGGTESLPYQYAGANATLRFYAPLVRRRLTLAFRVMGDGLFGHAPLNELARIDTMTYFGGVDGVRGVPSQRYYGRAKLLENLELRAKFFRVRVFDEHVTFGLAAFVDAGRVWADWQALPELDGTGLGIHYGVGGGPRVQVGEAFAIRFDAAYSPDAQPVGVYLKAGNIF